MFVNFEANTLIHSSQEMTAFVDQLVQRIDKQQFNYDPPDRRTEKRHAVAISVHAMPLDDDLRPIGHGFTATTREISARGIVLIHYKKVHAPFLAVELTDAVTGQFQAAVEMLRCRAVGPYFEMAGNFVTKVYDSTERKERVNWQLQQLKIQAEGAHYKEDNVCSSTSTTAV